MHEFMIIAVVLIFFSYAAHNKRLKMMQRTRQDQDCFDGLVSRIEAIEQRLTNLETIVIDHEKERQFERSLGEAMEPPRHQDTKGKNSV